MAFNYSAAYRQASRMESAADDLRSARTKLANYKSYIVSNWRGSEVSYITQAIDQAMQELRSAASDMDGIASDVRSVAYQLYLEDKAAEARQKAASSSSK